MFDVCVNVFVMFDCGGDEYKCLCVCNYYGEIVCVFECVKEIDEIYN